MTATTVGFALSGEDRKRLDHLSKKYTGGNRSALLRFALERLEAFERAEELKDLQRYGAARAAEQGVGLQDIPEIVNRVLAKHKSRQK